MKNMKVLFIAIISFVVIMIFAVLGIMLSSGKLGKSNTLNKDSKSTIDSYLRELNQGKYEEAYKKLASLNTKNISVTMYSELMNIMLDEKNASFEINDKVEPKLVELTMGGETAEEDKKDKNNKVVLSVWHIPIIRVYNIVENGETRAIQDDLSIGLIKEGAESKIYYMGETLDDYIEQYVLNKAERAAIIALENKDDADIVSKNVEIIERCLSYAKNVSASYSKLNDIMLSINLIDSYKYLAQGDLQSAITAVKSAYEGAQSLSDKVRAKRVESELYFSVGNNDLAVKALDEGLKLDPTNTDLKKDYGKLNSVMIESLNTPLKSGWDQLKSALEQGKKERNRILKDIALRYAEEALEVKQDVPDPYYLKGNILYCLGQYSNAISVLEQSLEYTNKDDSTFRDKVSEVLGMAKIAANSTQEMKFDKDSYKSVLDSEIRSYIFRRDEVSGVISGI